MMKLNCSSFKYKRKFNSCQTSHGVNDLRNDFYAEYFIVIIPFFSQSKKTFQKCKNQANNFEGEYFVRFRACKNFGQAKIDKFLISI